MIQSQSSGSLPSLVNKDDRRDDRPDGRWLSALHQLRVSIFRAIRRKPGSILGRQIAIATDQLLGCKLLLDFIRERQTAAPTIAGCLSSCAAQTVQELGLYIQTQCTSPILDAVFDPSKLNNVVSIPAANDIDWTMPRSRAAKHMELSDFGDFHQFCLSNPLIDYRDGLPASEGTHIRRTKGIHYSPAPLVDYLTARTLNRAVEHKCVSDLWRIRLLDLSCGCGAFLIAAIRYLFTLNRQFENSDLTTQQRLDLLGNVVHGVDIDAQAVEWTRRALLLAVWETSNDQDDDAPLRVPDLRKNIVCSDFLSMEFAPVDVILGGPPFVRLQTLRKVDRTLVRKYRAQYRTARSGQFDLYMLFFEQAVRHLQPDGWLGWSVSNTFLRSASGRSVRRLIASECTMHELVEFESRKYTPTR